MTTGSLKLASLLIVIAAGGGVAWQAQQGILHPAKATSESVAEESAEEEEAEEVSPEERPPIRSQQRVAQRKTKSSQWEEADETDAIRNAVVAGKIQRSPTKMESLAAPIPARKAARRTDDDLEEAAAKSPAKVDDDSTEDDDPFAVKISSKPSRRKSLTPIPESDPVVEEDEDRPETKSRKSMASDEESGSSDPFSDSGPVLLVGGEDETEADDAKPSRRRKSPKPLKETPALEESADDGDDPFAGAAPPDIGGKAAPAKKPHALELPSFTAEDDEADVAPVREKHDDVKPARNRRHAPAPKEEENDLFGAEPTDIESRPARKSPKTKPDESFDDLPEAMEEEPDPAPRRPKLPTEIDKLQDAEADSDDVRPRLGKPGSPGKRHHDDSGISEFDAETKSPPSRRSSRRNEEPPSDKSPQLLPVPDTTTDDADPVLTIEREPALTIESDEPAERPGRKRTKTEDLDGDAVPDHTAPKGMQQPRLTIEKIAPKQAVLGQPLIYSVVVKNAGSADAHHVTVEDRIPKGTKLEGTSPRAELIDKRLVWKLGTLKPDEQKKISVKVIPQEQGPIGSVAKVNFVAEITAEIEITAPQIVVSIESPSQVRLGDKLHMTFKVRNAGRADAQNVVVRNLIPDGLRHPAGADLEYAIGALPAQETREIKLDLIATKNGKVVNKTVITGDHGIKLEEETPIEVIGEQLLLTRTGKNKLYVDKAALFTSTIANEGTAPAAKVMVAEVIPAGMEFVSASDNGKFDPQTRAVTWSIGPIGPGEELKLSTQLMPKRTGDYRATVTVTGPAGSVATVDAELKVDGFPAVSVDSKSDTRLISVGEKATIRIQCKNQGTAAAKNLILSAELPPELKLVDGKGQTMWAHQGNVITFEAISHLNPNETAAFEIQVEGLTEGDTPIELQISADHLKRPLHRDETIRVAPESE